MAFELLNETEAYPIEEMINELAGVFGIYFGFSVISLGPLFQLAIKSLFRTENNNSINDNRIMRRASMSFRNSNNSDKRLEEVKQEFFFLNFAAANQSSKV